MPQRRLRLRPNADFLTDDDYYFAFLLTKDLGLGTVRQMRAQITTREYTEWMAWYRARAKLEKIASDKAAKK